MNMNLDKELIFFSAPGKIRLKPLSKTKNNNIDKKKIVNNYIIYIVLNQKRFQNFPKKLYLKGKNLIYPSSNI